MGHKGNGIDIDVDLAFDNFDILLVEFFYVSTFLPMCDIGCFGIYLVVCYKNYPLTHFHSRIVLEWGYFGVYICLDFSRAR